MNIVYQPLKRAIFLIATIFLSFATQGQSLSNYVFSTDNSSSLNRTAGSLIDDIDMNTGTTILIGGSQNNQTTALNNIGFDYFINGVRQTQFNVTSNGWVGVGSFASTAYGFLNAAAGVRLAPFLGTATTGIGTSAIGRVHYKVVGTQPNRVLVVEFLRMAINATVVNDTNTFQVRLYESNGSFEYVYGRMNATISTALNFNVGFQFSGTLYNNVNIVNHTSSSSSSTPITLSSSGYINNLNGSTLGNQRSYLWTPNPPDDPGVVSTSNITTSSMTVSWVNATNELGYAVYRSTDGGVTYAWVANIAQNVTTYNATGLSANTTYNWRIYSYRESISAPVDGSGTTLPSSRFYTIGNGNWSNPSIWNTNAVPGSQDSAEISTGNNVLLDAATQACGTLIVKGNLAYWTATAPQTLTVNGDVIVDATGNFNAGTGTGNAGTTVGFVLNIGGSAATSALAGNLVVDGVLDLSTTAEVQTIFYGTQSSTVTGSGATCELPFITVNKGLIDNTVEFLRTYTQPTASNYTNSQRIAVLSGTLKISAPVVTNSFHSFGLTLAQGVNARLWLNHSGISLGMRPGVLNTGTMQLQGEVRVDAGNLTVGTGSNNHFATTNGLLRINGGKVTLFGGFQLVGIASSQLIVTGGRLLIDPQDLQNLSNFTNILSIPSSSSFTFTGGSIEIVDPHSTAPTNTTIASINIQTGGTRVITGGLFVIGNGLSAPSGGPFSNVSGFGILSAIPLPKLYVDNNVSVSASRFCRLMGNTTITDSLVVNSNGYLFTGSAAVGYTLGVSGNIVNNGTIAGVIPTGTGNGIGALTLEGTSIQRVSGSGTATSLSVKVANAAGVNFSNSNPWALERITMEMGNVTNAPSSLTIGGATYRGNMIIGGLNETTTAGSFSIIPTFNTTFSNPSFTYGPAANALQTGSFNEIPAGGTTVVNLTVNDAQGLTVNRNVIVTGTLALTSGVLNMGANSLTLGVSAASTGILTRTSGLVQLASTGSFTRWFSTANSPAFDYALGFPLTTGTRERSLLMSLNGGFFSVGGSLTVRHSNTVGYTDILPTFTDGTTTINRRTNAYWLISSSTTPNIGLGNTLSIRLVGEGIGSVTDVTQLKMIKSSSLYPGTTVDGSGSIITPYINRDFPQAIVLGGGIFDTMYVGSNAAINPILPNIIAINTGLWNNVNTWEGGIIPTNSNSATIATGVNVTIPAAYTATCNGLSIMSGATLTASGGTLNNSASLTTDGDLIVSGATVNVTGSSGLGLTINSTGTATLSSGTLNIGTAGGSDRTLLSSGTLTISNGTLNLNGNLNIASGSSFNQTGGNINVDGNSGLSATSTASSVHLVSINTNNVNCSAGTITIIDPPHSSITANSTMSLRITAASSLTAFTGTHTFTFGNGVSTEVGNTNGFVIDVRRSGLLPIQNVIVNAGNGSGRWVSTSYSTGNFGTYIKGNLTINSGSELRHIVASTFVVGGDIINNGILTVSNSMTLGGNAYYPISNAQAISGTGIFRNNTTAPTASFGSIVTLDNGVGLNLNSTASTFSFSGTFNIGATKVTTGTNIVSLTSTGTLVRTTGYIIGNLSRYLTAGVNIARTYEIGSASAYLPVSVTFPSVTTAGNISIGIKDGDHPQIASSCINPSKSINRYWTVTNVSSVNTGGNYTFNFNTGDVDAGTVLASTKLFSYNGTAWLAGVTGTTSTTSFAINGLTNYGDIAIGEITPLTASVSIAASSSNICVGTNVTFTATVTNGGTAPTYQWKVNGINTVTTATFASSTLNNNDVVTCAVVSNSACVSVPNATSNSITMIVAPLTIPGGATGGTTICSGSTSGLLTLAGYTGSIVRWESAVAPFSTFNPIANTIATYTSGALTQTTQFRAVVQSGACASANSTTTSVTVDPATVAGTISGTNAVCSGLSAGNLTLSGNIGSVVRWESAVSPFSTFTAIANTTTTQSAGSPTQTIHYRAVVQSGSCAPVTTTSFIITVTPSSVGGTVSSNQTICTGSPVAQLTLAGQTGIVTKWQSASNASFTGAIDLPATAGLTAYTPTSVTVTTYYRAVVQSGTCALANSAASLITVNPAPVAGTLSGTNAVCSGNSPGALTLSGQTGTISFWQSKTGASWVNITNTTTTYNPGALTLTTQFRVVVGAGGGCAADTTLPFTVTVTPASVGGSVSAPQTICAGGAVSALTLTGQTGTINNWQSSSDLAFTTPTDIPATTGLTSYTPTSVTTTTYYRAKVTSGGCTTAFSSSALITVNPAPVAGTLSGTNAVCSGNSPGNLTLSGQTGTISFWQSKTGASWVNITNTTNTYNPGLLTVTTQFRVVVSSASCPADTTPAFTVTVTPASVGGSVSAPQTICAGGAVSPLTLTGQTGTINNWQSSPNAAFTTPTDIPATTGLTSYTPTSVTTTTYYRAKVTSGGCTTAFSSSALITVNPAPVAGTLSGTNAVCSGNSPGNLTLSGQTGTISFWQSKTGASWVNITNTTNTYNPGLLTVTTQFRVVVSSASCPADTTPAFTVTVTPASVGGLVSAPQTICAGGAVSPLTLTGQTGTINNWQSSPNAAFTTPTDIPATTGLTSYTPTSVTTTTYYRAKVTSGGCTTAFSSSALITVNPAPVAGTLSGTNAVCSGNSPGNLTLSGQTGTISFWQSKTGASWVNITNTTNTYNPGLLTVTTQFRVVVSSASCPADTTPAFTVTVTPASVGGSVSAPQTICAGGAVSALTLTGQTGTINNWQSSSDLAFTTPTDIPATTGLTSYTPTSVTTTTYYRAKVTSGGCTTAFSSSALITVNPAPVAGTLSGTNAVCSGNSPGNLTLSGQTGTISFWQSKTGASWVNITNTTNTYNPGLLTVTTQFRVVVSLASCPADTTPAFTVTVTPASVGGSVSAPQTICAGGAVSPLTLTGQTGTINNWQSSPNAAFTTPTDIPATTGLTSYTPTSVTTTTYYRAKVTSGGCTTAFSSSALITVNPAPVAGTLSGTNAVCSGNSPGNLTLSGQTGTISFWQSKTGASWVNITNTTNTYNPGLLTVTTQFRVVVSSASCPADTTPAFTVTVTPASVGGLVSAPQTICVGDPITSLSLTGHVGNVLKWQSSPNAAFTTPADIPATIGLNSYTPAALTSTTYFRAVIQSGTCTIVNSSSVTITVNPASVGGTVSSNQTICAGSPVTTLNLTGQTGSITKWQSANDPAFSTPTDIIGTAGFTSYTPVGVLTNTYYRAVVTSGGCTPANSASALITVNAAPVAGTLSGTNAVCSGNSPGNLTLSGQTGTISFWQSKTGASWVNISNTTNTYNPGSLTITTQFRVVVSSGSCAADTTPSFTVTVTSGSVGGSVSAPQTICAGGAVSALTLTGQTGTIDNWQSSPDIAFTTPTDIPATTGLTSYTPTSVTATTYFRAKVTSGGCATAFSSSVLITVNSTAVAGTLAGTNAVCAGNSPGNLTLSGQTGTISFWQSNTGSGWVNISNTTTTYNPGVLTVSTSFRVIVASGLCPADTTPAFAVTVTPATVGGSVSANQTICTGDPITSLLLTAHVGSIVKWQSATNPSFTGATDIAGTAGLTSYTPTALSSTTYFRAVIQSGTCAIVNSSSVTITVNPAAISGTVTGSTPICSGSSSTLFLSGQVGTITKWQISTNAPLFNTWTDVANTTTSLTTGALTQTSRYRAIIASGSCTPVTTNEFEVSVTSSGIWTGIVNSNWNNAGNWCGGVPTTTTNVIIPAGTVNSPIINISNATVNDINVETGATLSFNGTTNSLDIKGSLVVDGTFNTIGGQIIFSGTAAQNVAGISYDALRMNGIGVKSLTGNAQITGNLDLVSGNLQLGNFNLVVATIASVVGSASSYVITNGTGSFTINGIGSSARVFAVGTPTSYTPLSIANNGTADNISVKVLQGVYNSYLGEVGSGAPISLNVVNKTFIVNEATAGGSSLDITFTWNGSDESGMNRAQTIVGRYNGGVWSNISGASAAASGSNPYTFNITGVTNLGILGVGDINSPLPVRLVSFTAKLKKGLTNLAWTTASELNNNYFEIERSTDGYNFNAIGTVKAKGNSNSRFDYTFVDQESLALLGTANVLYYRLKQYDMSGHSDKSNVVSVNLFGAAVFEVVSTVPNPFNSETIVSFKTSSNSVVDVQLNDAFGKLIKTETMMPTIGSNSYHVELNNEFAPGIYFVKITQDGVSKVVKVIKR